MALEIVKGLEQLHAMHILDLDIKPGNVLLDDCSHAYLSDFGISHALRTFEACTAVTTSAGSPHYMQVNRTQASNIDLCSQGVCLLQHSHVRGCSRLYSVYKTECSYDL